MANNFDDDSRIIEYWLFENNLTAGKAGNNLTAAAGGVGYESGSPLEGSYSLDLENASNQWAYRNDADLSAGFPLKNGDTNKKFSWAFWVKPESLSTSHYVLTKFSLTSRSFAAVLTSDGTLQIRWGSGASSSVDWNSQFQLTAGQVYHIGIAVDGVARTLLLRVYDATAGTAQTQTKTDWGVDLNVTTIPFVAGARGDYSTTYDYDGLIDELVIADHLLSADEFDRIRLGTYAGWEPHKMTSLTECDQAEWQENNLLHCFFLVF